MDVPHMRINRSCVFPLLEALFRRNPTTDMPRYKKNPDALRKRTNLTIDPALWAAAQDLCYAEGLSVSEVVNQLLKEKVAEAQREKREQRTKKK